MVYRSWDVVYLSYDVAYRSWDVAYRSWDVAYRSWNLAYRSWGSGVALLKCVAHLRGVAMKQISVVEEKNPFTLSLKICPEAC